MIGIELNEGKRMPAITVRAEFSAVVLKLCVAPGDRVARDQELLVLESMKTEIPVTSPADGHVGAISVSEAQAVDERQVLLVIET